MPDIPLFPLSSVLFPGGLLRLQIFEQRYLDMLRECSRSGSGFGVCLNLASDKPGEPAAPVAIGTLAKIIDFYSTPKGLLGLQAQGGARFHVDTLRIRDNGLMHSEVCFWPDEPALTLPAQFGLLATVLDRLLERMGGPFAKAARVNFDDASWVGFRLAELLPLQLSEQQHLLQMTDPLKRLEQLLHYLPRFQQD